MPLQTNILVTGASGFLGRKLVPALEAMGHSVVQVSSKTCDLRDQRSFDQFQGKQFHKIYHLAAWTQAGDFCLRHPGEQWVINQQINTNLLAWWHSKQPEAKLISVGTSCSYDSQFPLTENNYLKGQPIESLFTYGMTKRMLLIGQMSLAKQFGARYLTVVPSTLYGPGYHTDGRQLHFIFDLIRKVIRGQERGEKVELWGDGHQRRELIHVDDFVRLMLRLENTTENDLVNIGAGEEFSIRHFAKLICDFVGYDPERIIYDTTKYVGAKSKCLDTSKLKNLIPDLALTPLREGLGKTVSWFKEQRHLL